MVFNYLEKDNMNQDIANEPKVVNYSGKLSTKIKKSIEKFIKHVPSFDINLLAGVYYFNDIGGTGYTEYINKPKSDRTGWDKKKAFMVFDFGILSGMEANDWATWRDSSVFNLMRKEVFTPASPIPSLKTDGYSVQIELSDKTTQTQDVLIDYIVFHELAHVYKLQTDLVPLDPHPHDMDLADRFEFIEASWVPHPNDNRYFSELVEEHDELRNMRFYFASERDRLSSDKIPVVYKHLEFSNFPSLYAMTSYKEDFAESMAIYLHNKVFNRPYRIKVLKNDKVVREFESCIVDNSCPRKIEILSRIIKK